MEKFLVKTKRSECDSSISSHSVTLNVDHDKSQDGDGGEQNQQDTMIERVVYSLDDFQVPVERLSRDEYIRRGPIRPEITSYVKSNFSGGKLRSFQKQWYDSRPWLEYNQTKDAAFCFPCRLFSNAINKDATFHIDGYRNWSAALGKSKGFDRHASSEQHLTCMEKWNAYLKITPVDVQLITEQRRRLELGNKERQERHDILPILADLTNTLARLRLPFRGHDETESSENRGVFRELAQCIARWNLHLARHFEKAASNPQGYPSYASPSSQNELIHSCAEILKNGIVAEIKKAKFFSICLDTTPDLSKQDQLSFIARYVNDNGEVTEALVEVQHVHKGDAFCLFSILHDLLEKNDLSIHNIRGQGYDGCSTMSGKYSGLQARVKEICPSAYFVHCFCHRLNLVVVDSCSKNVVTRNFFGIVENLYAFIEGSTKRHGLFQDIQGKMAAEDDSSKPGTLKSLSKTRWSTRFDNVRVLLETLPALVATLNKITDSGDFDRESAGNAVCLKNAINFEFCLCLVTLSPLLQLINVTSKYLQTADMDVSAACILIESLIASLESLRSTEHFYTYWAQAIDLGETINVEYAEPRIRKVSCRIDSATSNETRLTGPQKYCVTFYFETLDLMLSALTTRFSSENLPLLKSIKCLSTPVKENVDALTTLSSYYHHDVNVNIIVQEYELFCKAIEMQHVSIGNVHNIFLHMVNMKMVAMFPNISTLYPLILTLPATSVSCERSFSAFGFVKNKLRTTMTQGRLSDLMLIAVEGERAKTVDIDRVVEYFWKSFDVQRR